MNVDMKKVLDVLLPQFAEHELPYLTQTLRSDAMAMKENYKLGLVEVAKMMSQLVVKAVHSEMVKNYLRVFVLMLSLHIFLYVWKVQMPLVLHLSQPFDMKMVAMAGMCILTVVVLFISQVRNSSLSVWPKQFGITTVSVVLLSVLMLLFTAVCFTKGPGGLDCYYMEALSHLFLKNCYFVVISTIFSSAFTAILSM